MLDTLFEIFKKAKTKHVFAELVITIQRIVDCLEEQFKEDPIAKHDALECLIKLLQSHHVPIETSTGVADAPSA